MIRGNWSLSAELKKNERKQQQKVQNRQKQQHKKVKLASIDPIRLYYQIQRLEKSGELSDRDQKYLYGLKEDWDFIVKNNLHQTKLKPFLEQEQKKEKVKQLEKTKLHGLKSIYFNPELNPLGKIPNPDALPNKPIHPLPNFTKPLKKEDLEKYAVDPLINQLGIVVPEGDPPRFYKLVQNTQKKNYENLGAKAEISSFRPTNTRKRMNVEDKDSGEESQEIDSSDDEMSEENEETEGNEETISSELAYEEEEYLTEKQSKKPKLV